MQRRNRNDNNIDFIDENFEKVIREHINKPEGKIYNRDLLSIKSLNASSRNISSISRIERLSNLQGLYLDNNNIMDITPLFNYDNSFRFLKVKQESKVHYGTMCYIESMSSF